MKLAGLILDQHDDSDRTVFARIFPQQDDVPGLVKSASALDASTRAALPEDLFALVLVNGEDELRKFAHYDAGTTVLSTHYLLAQGKYLPNEAVKVAAHNLCAAWLDYGAEPPAELQKLSGARWALAPFILPHTAKKAARETREILMSDDMMPKTSEVNGSTTNTLSKFPRAGRSGFTDPKVAHTDVPPDAREAPGGEMPKELPQARINPRVDVTTFTGNTVQVKKASSRYALGTRYPLDSYKHVEQAVEYFGKYASRLSPAERHEYCGNVAERAAELSYKIPAEMGKYASVSYAPAPELLATIEMRRKLAAEEHHPLLAKVAEQTRLLPPTDFCHLLEAFDKAAGIAHLYDAELPDPYYSTFGSTKTAEDAENWSDMIGNLYVTGKELQTLAKTGREHLCKVFGKDFVDEFQKEPIAIYNSMPVDQKKMIIRMANENAPGTSFT